MIELTMIESVIGEDGDPIEGDRTVIATINDGELAGRMAPQIRPFLGMTLRYGTTGETFRVTLREPWTVAYAISIDNAAFMDAGITKTGAIVAIKNGRELKPPARYRENDDIDNVVF